MIEKDLSLLPILASRGLHTYSWIFLISPSAPATMQLKYAWWPLLPCHVSSKRAHPWLISTVVLQAGSSCSANFQCTASGCICCKPLPKSELPAALRSAFVIFLELGRKLLVGQFLVQSDLDGIHEVGEIQVLILRHLEQPFLIVKRPVHMARRSRSSALALCTAQHLSLIHI